MNYQLKDKIKVTPEFLDAVCQKSWQEIEHLQSQIANLADESESIQLQQLLKALLTSYYVFVGGVETLLNDPVEEPIKIIEKVSNPEEDLTPELPDKFLDNDNTKTDEYTIIEPFEYFIDFDEPIGDPISDKDPYNN